MGAVLVFAKVMPMAEPTLENVAAAVLRRAQRQGYVVPRDVRSELKLANLPEDQWKDVLEKAKSSLNYRQGRYYHIAAVSPAIRQQQDREEVIARAIRSLIRQHRRKARQQDRRGQARVDFILPVQVIAEDGKKFSLLSRDLSPTGIRLVGTKRLLGHKVQIWLPLGDGEPGLGLLTRILWTCATGDDLFENGGSFLEILDPSTPLNPASKD
jgi:hypothetical protein